MKSLAMTLLLTTSVLASPDTATLQIFWCQTVREDTPDVQGRIYNLTSAGGWFAIRALQRLLEPDAQANFYRAMRKAPPSDLGRQEPRSLALDVLPMVITDGPITESTRLHINEQAKEIAMWNDWIAAHRAELSKREPTGDGVDFSLAACKNGQPVKHP